MEKRFCLTSCLHVLPVRGMGVVCLLNDFAPFCDFFLALRLPEKNFHRLFASCPMVVEPVETLTSFSFRAIIKTESP